MAVEREIPVGQEACGDIDDGVHHRDQIDRDGRILNPAALNAADVQHVVDQRQQMLRAVADLVKTGPDFGPGILLERNVCKPDDGVHGGTDVMGHVVQEGALCGIGRLRLHAKAVQLLVGLLLHSHPDGASLDADEADRRQQEQKNHNRHEKGQRPDGRLHHAHGADRHSFRRNQQHQRHVIVFKRREAVVIFAPVQQDVGDSDTLLLQMRLDRIEALPPNILRFPERLVNIARAEDIVRVRVIIGQRAVVPDDVGSGASAVGCGRIILLDGPYVLEQHNVGKANLFFSHGHGRVQLLGEYQKAPVNAVGLGDKGMPPFPVHQVADIIPDARRPVAQIRRALLVQQHHPAAIQIRTEVIFQMRDIVAHVAAVFIAAPLQRVVQPRHQIPVGLKAVFQVGADLLDHLLHLAGALVDRQLHQSCAHAVHAPRQGQSQNQRKRDGQENLRCAFPFSHPASPSSFFCLPRSQSAAPVYLTVM